MFLYIIKFDSRSGLDNSEKMNKINNQFKIKY